MNNTVSSIQWLMVSLVLTAATCYSPDSRTMKETQLTFGKYGHTLNASQVYSPDGTWVIYDTRNDDTHISRTQSIEMVNITSGEIRVIYQTSRQSLHGPGVGAAAVHPIDDKLIYIHGLENCSEELPYGFTRRFGAISNLHTRTGYVHAEARAVTKLVPGALRGGTHAHTWSGDGNRISFTYNDYLIEGLEKKTNGKIKDLRTIGVMVPGQVNVPDADDESFPGTYFSAVTATVAENPKTGSDDIDRAFDECWIGTNGYRRKDGTLQRYAVAFQGNVRDVNNHSMTEVYVADIPEDITHGVAGYPVEGTDESRPNVPSGVTQRRITFTAGQKYPGVQGPRCRLRSSPDGSLIYFPMKDDNGVIQVFNVNVQGGEIMQVTRFSHSIEGQFNLSPDGSRMSCPSGHRIRIVDLQDGTDNAISEADTSLVGGALWSPDGQALVYNRYVPDGDEKYLQIFRMTVN